MLVNFLNLCTPPSVDEKQPNLYSARCLHFVGDSPSNLLRVWCQEFLVFVNKNHPVAKVVSLLLIISLVYCCITLFVYRRKTRGFIIIIIFFFYRKKGYIWMISVEKKLFRKKAKPIVFKNVWAAILKKKKKALSFLFSKRHHAYHVSFLFDLTCPHMLKHGLVWVFIHAKLLHEFQLLPFRWNVVDLVFIFSFFFTSDDKQWKSACVCALCPWARCLTIIAH